MLFSIEAVKRDQRLCPTGIKADILPDALERYVQLFTDLLIHFVAFSDVIVFFRAFRKVNPGMDFAVVAPRSLQREVGFFFDQKHIQLPAGEFPRNGYAGNAAADNQHVGRSAVQRLVAKFRHAHRLFLNFVTCKVVDHVYCAVFLRRRLTGNHDFLPRFDVSGKHNAAVRKLGAHGAAEAGSQFFVNLL